MWAFFSLGGALLQGDCDDLAWRLDWSLGGGVEGDFCGVLLPLDVAGLKLPHEVVVDGFGGVIGVDLDGCDGDQERIGGGGGGAGHGCVTDDALDGEFGVVELLGGAWLENVWRGAADGFGDVGEREFFEFNAQEVGGLIAEVLDAVAFGTGGSDAEGAGPGGWTGNDHRRRFIMSEADLAGVIEIDVDGGEVGMIVDGDFLVRAVVDADDLQVGIVEDEFVVVREGFEGILGGGGAGDQDCEGDEQDSA